MTEILTMGGLWLLWTGILFGLAVYLAKRYPSNTSIWWGALLLAFCPLLPVPEGIEFSAIPVAITLPSLPESILPMSASQLTGSELSVPNNGTAIFLWSCYIAEVLFLLSKLLYQYTGLHRVCRSAEVIKLGRHRCYQLPAGGSPFVFGVFKPRVYVPEEFKALPATEQQALLYHELTHISCGDHLAVLAWRLVVILSWFNPFIRLMEKQFVRSMEFRCDQITLDRNGLCRKYYARALLNSLKRSTQSSAAMMPGFSSRNLGAEDYKKRFLLIMNSHKRSGVMLLLALMVTLFSGILFAKVQYSAAPIQNSESWAYPLADTHITSGFGHVSRLRQYKKHGGVDFGAPKGTPITPVADGLVVIADQTSLSKNYGKVVVLQHANGYESLYAHLSEIKVQPGMKVYKGQTIGLVGATGKTTGPHLHLEIIKEDKRLDPLAIIDGR